MAFGEKVPKLLQEAGFSGVALDILQDFAKGGYLDFLIYGKIYKILYFSSIAIFHYTNIVSCLNI